MNKFYIFLIIISFILLFLIFYIFDSVVYYSHNLDGFWSAPDDFCIDAGIDMFWVYICKSKIWVIIKKQKKEILNIISDFNISFDPIYLLPILHNNSLNGKLIIHSDSDENIFPSHQFIIFYPHIPKLVFYSKAQIYAVLYKNPHLSDISSKLLSDENDNSVF